MRSFQRCRFLRALGLCAALSLVFLVSAKAAKCQAVRIDAELRIRGSSSEIFPVWAMAVRVDGVMAFTQVQDNTIRLFDSSGKVLGRVGRTGEGPGEFKRIGQIGWNGKTLWAADAGLRRVTSFENGREVSTTIAPIVAVLPPKGAGTGDASPFFSPSFHALRRDGSLIVIAQVSPAATIPVWGKGAMAGGAVIRVAPDGRFLGLVAMSPVVPESPSCNVRLEGGRVVGVPFCAGTIRRVSQNGELFAAVLPEGDGNSRYRVVLVGAQGDTVFSKSYQARPTPIPKRVRDSVLASRVALGQTPAERATLSSRLRVPTHYPPFEVVMLGNDSTVWLKHESMIGGAIWTVLDRTGKPLGEPAFSTMTNLLVVSREMVWGTEEDVDGYFDIVRYRLSFPRK